MQYRPTAAELLDTVAALLDDELLPALPAHLQHKARVAANVARIVARESALGPDADRREVEALTGLLGQDGDLPALRTELAERLRRSEDEAFDRAAWEVLVAATRDELAIAKPGYDAWEGQ